ncbi:glycosyltransferase family 4 protein [Silvibacterium sp.]|uniref:glycosyltransferase family 4 protein n=1 Tax=Silvibacterium sp. TaxID=1964179 RepID=UPI0039E2E429
MAKKRKRILFIDIGTPMGGVETYLLGLATMLGDHADLFAVCVLPELAEAMRREGVRVYVTPAFGGMLKPLRFLAALAVAVGVIIWQSIDVVQMNGMLESIFLIPARILGRETVYSRHGPFEKDVYSWFRSPHKYFPRLASRMLVRLSTNTVSVSETVGRDLESILPVERARVIPNWVSKIPEMPRDLNETDPNRLEILYVGRLERYKGLHLLIEALRGVPRVKLTVVGDGPYRKELEAMAEGLDVEFAGFRKDPEVFYARTDIFVMPSMGPEGLPMVCLEAMGHGLPCVFSSLDVHHEITEGGNAALLFDNGHSEVLVEQLRQLLADSALRVEYGRRARELVLRKYHPAAARRAYLAVFGVGGEILTGSNRVAENLGY